VHSKLPIRKNGDRIAHPEPILKPFAAFVTLVPLAALALLAYKFRFLPWTPSRVAGLLVAILGLAALTVARVELGNSFSVAPRATPLVTRGLYSRIRNPVYIFTIVGLGGLFLYLGTAPVFPDIPCDHSHAVFPRARSLACLKNISVKSIGATRRGLGFRPRNLESATPSMRN
jgi:hypothetical protein